MQTPDEKYQGNYICGNYQRRWPKDLQTRQKRHGEPSFQHVAHTFKNEPKNNLQLSGEYSIGQNLF
jgi:hypothetical protein